VNSAQVMNLGQLLSQSAQQFPQRIGLIQGDQQWTWYELQERVNAMAHALQQLGVRKGDKILTQSRNNVQMFESCWVAFQLGCVWVPTNFRLSPPEVAYLAQSSHANVMICESVFAQHIDAALDAAPTLQHVIAIGTARQTENSYEDLVARHLGQQPSETTVGYDDPLWYFYTSGTTGKPKAGILTHGQNEFCGDQPFGRPHSRHQRV
jgi:fatty-acyl-CoA synthase